MPDANIVDRDSPEPLSEYLDLLPGYNPSWNQDFLLDETRKIWDADNYYWLGVPFPVGNEIAFNIVGRGFVNETKNGDILIPAFSILTKISVAINQVFMEGQQLITQNTGCKVRLYDKGGKVDMIHKQFGYQDLVAGQMRGEFSGLLQPPPDDPFGPYYLLEPKQVMPPGVLHWEITDLSGIATNPPAGSLNVIQFLLAFAVPINTQSTGKSVMEEG